MTDQPGEQPYGPGAICDTCGHFAMRHDEDGCHGVNPVKGCVYGKPKGSACKVMRWLDTDWPRPWLPAPEGLVKEAADGADKQR